MFLLHLPYNKDCISSSLSWLEFKLHTISYCLLPNYSLSLLFWRLCCSLVAILHLGLLSFQLLATATIVLHSNYSMPH